jgi:hydroxyacylglutathione hydrolase
MHPLRSWTRSAATRTSMRPWTLDDTSTRTASTRFPRPGHSDGSTCYLVTGVDGETYLFTGDTMFPTGDGTWSTFLVPGRGGAAALRSSLELLATVRPDIVISSAFGGDTAIETLGNGRWQKCIAEALASVPS